MLILQRLPSVLAEEAMLIAQSQGGYAACLDDVTLTVPNKWHTLAAFLEGCIQNLKSCVKKLFCSVLQIFLLFILFCTILCFCVFAVDWDVLAVLWCCTVMWTCLSLLLYCHFSGSIYFQNTNDKLTVVFCWGAVDVVSCKPARRHQEGVWGIHTL